MPSELEKIIGYTFNNPALLDEAMTHPSISGKNRGNSYERLEFLGDSVLSLIIAQMLLTQFPNEPEGSLAKRHAALVSGKTLGEIAASLGLGAFMKLSESEAQAGGRENPTNLEDALEAMIGAIYLDGGLEVARSFIMPLWEKLSESAASPPKDAKSSLQEWAQGKGLPLPAYTVVETTGPAHSPMFTVEVSVEGGLKASATGKSKKSAEQDAASFLLEKLPQAN